MSRAGAKVLQFLVKRWPDPTRRWKKKFEAEPATEAFEWKYTEEQFYSRVQTGSPLREAMPSLVGKRVLEIGCGHGGVSCYLAAIGARSVVGLDLGTIHMVHGRKLAAQLSVARGTPLPVTFGVGDGHRLPFRDGSLDVIVADNLFEHFRDPGQAMKEMFRTLAPGGLVVVPIFSSIRSKWGLHLKLGIKMPWANLVFSEDSIVRALKAEAVRRPELHEYYPGIATADGHVADVRRFRDLNDITYAAFKKLAAETGFELQHFGVHATRLGRLATRALPKLESSSLLDVLSTGAGAVLRRP